VNQQEDEDESMATCDNCGTNVKNGTSPDPRKDICFDCEASVCQHCVSDMDKGPPYHHADPYCENSEEE
jgi:hypothetical protein